MNNQSPTVDEEDAFALFEAKTYTFTTCLERHHFKPRESWTSPEAKPKLFSSRKHRFYRFKR